MTSDQAMVLKFLADNFRGEGWAYSFRPIICETLLPRDRVRRAARALARKGFAAYHRGLWTDDGTPAGAGYAATAAGIEHLEGLKL